MKALLFVILSGSVVYAEENSDLILIHRATMTLLYCKAQTARQEALGEIATQRKYSKVAGVVNKSDLYRQQQIVRISDARIRLARAVSKSFKNKLLGCDHEAVIRVTECRDQGIRMIDNQYVCTAEPELSAVKLLVQAMNDTDL